MKYSEMLTSKAATMAISGMPFVANRDTRSLWIKVWMDTGAFTLLPKDRTSIWAVKKEGLFRHCYRHLCL